MFTLIMMRNKSLLYLTIAFLFVQPYISQALPADSLVHLAEIHYNSPFEKGLFEDYFQHHKKDYLALFMAVSKETGNSEFTQGQPAIPANPEPAAHSQFAQKKRSKKDQNDLQPDTRPLTE
jgi:hypothetical protein